MKATTPPPNESILREALLCALRERGLEPREDWVSVRVVNAPWPRERTYTAIIAYHPTRLALSNVLRRVTNSGKKAAVEVWVLNESEARQLCEGTSKRAQSASEEPAVAR